MTARLKSFAHFDAFLRAISPMPTRLIWRGQANPQWPLLSSLDRLRESEGLAVVQSMTERHLQRFKDFAKRRLVGVEEPRDDNNWWALGRHFGLDTPLLDWSTSPWKAAFFAYNEPPRSNSRYCALYALDRPWLEQHGERRPADHEPELERRGMNVFQSSNAYNFRQGAQGGLYSRTPDGVTVEQCVDESSPTPDEAIALLRVLVPSAERAAAIRHLGLMGIAHSELFPDLSGAAEQANLEFGTFNHMPNFYRSEFLTGDDEASRQPMFDVAAASPGELDPVRSSLRASKPIFSTSDATEITFTARDADGNPIAGFTPQVRSRIVKAGIENPFR